jgi:hypothetical protein
MGLSFSHGGAHWSYSGFREFRLRLAREIGLETLNDLALLRGEALMPLLCHSDCDGELSPTECATVAPRLREVVSRWAEEFDGTPGSFASALDRREALKLAQGMEECAALGLPLVFC